MPEHERPEYMQWVTGNIGQMIPNKLNLVACVDCRRIYETYKRPRICNELACGKCGTDAIVVVACSPLRGLSEPEQRVLLDKWHAQGFTPIEKTTTTE